MERITKDKDNLIINLTIPLKTKRQNPYDESPGEEMNNIIGVIDGHEIGFANVIDMSYKGKADQTSRIHYLYHGDKEEFRKLCKDLKIDIEEYESCIKCNKSVYGAYQWTKEGPICMGCE